MPQQTKQMGRFGPAPTGKPLATGQQLHTARRPDYGRERSQRYLSRVNRLVYRAGMVGLPVAGASGPESIAAAACSDEPAGSQRQPAGSAAYSRPPRRAPMVFAQRARLSKPVVGPARAGLAAGPLRSHPSGRPWSIHEGVAVSSDRGPGAGGASQYSGGQPHLAHRSQRSFRRKPMAKACLCCAKSTREGPDAPNGLARWRVPG